MNDEMSPRTKASATAVIVDLQREVSKLKDQRADWEDDLRRVSAERDEARARVRMLEGERMNLCETLRGIIETFEGEDTEGLERFIQDARDLLDPDFGPAPGEPEPKEPF